MTSTHTPLAPARVEPDRGSKRTFTVRCPASATVRVASQAFSSWLDDRRPTSGVSRRPARRARLRGVERPRTRPRSFPSPLREESRFPRSGDTFHRPEPFSGLPRTSTLRAAVRTSVVLCPRRFCHLEPGLRSRPRASTETLLRPDDRLTIPATRLRCVGTLPNARPSPRDACPGFPIADLAALSERTVTRFPDCEPQRRAPSSRP